MPSSINPIYSFLNLEGEKVALSMRRMTLSLSGGFTEEPPTPKTRRRQHVCKIEKS
jgi:hypothetical protein